MGKGNKAKTEENTTVEEPKTKLCPYCYTEIKYEATRCPNCTSVLEEDKKEEDKQMEEIDKQAQV